MEKLTYVKTMSHVRGKVLFRRESAFDMLKSLEEEAEKKLEIKENEENKEPEVQICHPQITKQQSLFITF